jgi:cytochrome c oxidase subunit 4
MAASPSSSTGHASVDSVGGSHASHGVGHVVSPKILIATAAALLVMTALTVTASKVAFDKIEMHELTIVVCLAIALVKASIVCLFFMHLKWDRPFNAFVLVGSLSLVVLFITFALTDTTEYQHEIIKDESTLIQGELAKLPPPLPEEVVKEREHETHK